MKSRFLYRAWKARLRDQSLEIQIARSFVRPGDLAVDAGANKGAYLYWLRQFAGPSGTVLAYEPQPALARYLEKVRERFGWKNVKIEAVALSDQSGKSTLHVPGSGVSPGASLESSVLDHSAGQRFECAIDTLDHQLEGLSRLAFCKVDVEGHELALFRGARQTLVRDHPPLLFECEARHLVRHSMTEVFDFLRGLGYEGYFIQDSFLSPLAHFQPEVHQRQNAAQFWNAPDYCNNFLFLTSPLPSELARWVKK